MCVADMFVGCGEDCGVVICCGCVDRVGVACGAVWWLYGRCDGVGDCVCD